MITWSRKKKDIKDFSEFKENEGTTCPKLWDTMESVLRGKLITLSASKMKLETAYTSNVIAHLKAIEEKRTNTPKSSTWQEIIKLRAEINQIETKQTLQSTKPEAGSLKKINKTDKPLARLTGGHRDSIQIKKIRRKKGDITTVTEDI